jgi:hypothetical protein
MFRTNVFNIYEAYKIFKAHKNDLLIAENKFLTHIRNLFQCAEEKKKLDDIFYLLKNSERFNENIYIKSFTCHDTYLDCKNRLGVDPNTCKTAYYTCADNCASLNEITCSSYYAQRCSGK